MLVSCYFIVVFTQYRGEQGYFVLSASSGFQSHATEDWRKGGDEGKKDEG